MKQVLHYKREQFEDVLSKFNLGPLANAEYLEGGSVNSVILLNGLYVLKINQRDRHIDKLAREVLSYKLCAGSSKLIPVPEVIGYDSSQTIIPYEYLLVAYLPGQTLEAAFSHLPGHLKDTICHELGHILAQIHRIRLDQFGDIVNLDRGLELWETYFAHAWATTFERIARENVLEVAVLKKLENYYQLNRDSLVSAKVTPVLCHSDYKGKNLKIYRSRLSAVLDFEWCFAGDRLWDFRHLSAGMFVGEGFSERHFLSGYGQPSLNPDELTRVRLYRLKDAMDDLYLYSCSMLPHNEAEISERRTAISLIVDNGSG